MNDRFCKLDFELIFDSFENIFVLCRFEDSFDLADLTLRIGLQFGHV